MITVIIPCAGKGERFKNSLPKQYHPLKGIPIFIRTILAFETHPLCNFILLGVTSSYLDYVKDIIKSYNLKKIYKIVVGGETRQETVYKTLLEAPIETKIFLVHDAVRPLVSQELISKIISASEKEIGVVPVLPVRDALIKGDNDYLQEPLERRKVFQVQTPQAISAKILKECLEKALEEGKIFPDEGSLLHHYGYRVKLVEGSIFNFKITFPEDLILAENLITD
ncbi:MAG: 2-C-methyl-D-erythritol 4-phosphate cytidylyltransferase [Caldimicrobium sp.]